MAEEKLGLLRLYDAVVASLEADNIPITSAFGWREAPRTVTGPRMVWIPGDTNGALGSIGGAKNINRLPRPLASLAELCVIEIYDADATQITDDRLQYTRARTLLDLIYRALHRASKSGCVPAFTVVGLQYVKPTAGLRHGLTVRLTISVDTAVLDEALDPAAIGVLTHAEIDTALLDHTTLVVAPQED